MHYYYNMHRNIYTTSSGPCDNWPRAPGKNTKMRCVAVAFKGLHAQIYNYNIMYVCIYIPPVAVREVIGPEHLQRIRRCGAALEH